MDGEDFRREEIDLKVKGLLDVMLDLQERGYREFPGVEGGDVIYTHKDDAHDVAVLSHLGRHKGIARVRINYLRVFDDSQEAA